MIQPHNNTLAIAKTFNYRASDVRTVLMENEPWFALPDVCKILELKNPTNFLKSRRCDPKGVYQTYPLPTKGGPQDTTLVNVGNLFTLIARSDKPEAIDFQHWVNHEVLPSLFKTGIYIMPSDADRTDLAEGLDFAKEILTLKQKVGQMEMIAHEAIMEVPSLPTPNHPTLPDMSNSAELNRAARVFSQLSGVSIKRVWPMVYEEVEFRFGIRLAARKQQKAFRGTTVQFAVKHNYGDLLYSILHAMIRQAEASRLRSFQG